MPFVDVVDAWETLAKFLTLNGRFCRSHSGGEGEQSFPAFLLAIREHRDRDILHGNHP